jgi:hypothetical protein
MSVVKLTMPYRPIFPMEECKIAAVVTAVGERELGLFHYCQTPRRLSA